MHIDYLCIDRSILRPKFRVENPIKAKLRVKKYQIFMIPWSPIVSRWSSLNVPYAWMTAVAQNATKCPTVDVYFALIVSQVILNQKSKMEIHHLHTRTQLVEKQSRSGISRFMLSAINSIVLKDYNLTEHLIRWTTLHTVQNQTAELQRLK